MGGIGDSLVTEPRILGLAAAELFVVPKANETRRREGYWNLEGERVLQSRPPGEEKCCFVKGHHHNLTRREEMFYSFVSSFGAPIGQTQKEARGHRSPVTAVTFAISILMTRNQDSDRLGDFANL